MLAAAWLALLASVPAVAAVKTFETREPRDFGYVIGDLVQREFRLELERPYRLAADELPAAGPVNLWLEREPVVVRDEESAAGRVYDLTVTYRLVGVPDSMTRIAVPEWQLVITDGGQVLPLAIPPWSFTVSPVTTLAAPANPGFVTLQPDRAPLPAPWLTHARYMLLLGMGVIAAVLYFAYAFWAVPWLQRTRGPFARAYRRLRALRSEPRPENQREALRCLHQAFNETYGQALFAEGLTRFFAGNEKFRSLREPIEDLYRRSEAAFSPVRARARERRCQWTPCCACVSLAGT